ncbi:hypothetical protein CLV59_104124 [Chitinophaga dinghuensis]|uniref:Uncharacterized protein n=1 Tax=Chitinophaga dinghuensis TaxID=1539050 RepID=A0A327VY61_9BACT|nr:hypothetical protein [Chitinophaga dinghuensis]RAJ81899.1 hypothetical protein CLV59_104124 [Chitinophaga dinghuensis]
MNKSHEKFRVTTLNTDITLPLKKWSSIKRKGLTAEQSILSLYGGSNEQEPPGIPVDTLNDYACRRYLVTGEGYCGSGSSGGERS